MPRAFLLRTDPFCLSIPVCFDMGVLTLGPGGVGYAVLEICFFTYLTDVWKSNLLCWIVDLFQTEIFWTDFSVASLNRVLLSTRVLVRSHYY